MITLLSALALSAQPLPPAERLPPPDFSDKAIAATIDGLLATLETGDALALLKLVYPDGRVTGQGTFPGGASGLRTRSFTEYAARMTPGSGFVERITSPVIEQDGDVALVWAPFTITMGGKLVSCGYDHFDLVRENGAWKVMNLTFSSRTQGCGA